MAMAGEGSSYGGGAGGKFQKRPLRRPQSTPYDRPIPITRNTRGESWISKLVDPASKFISARAFKIFSNFRKRLTVAKQEPENGRLEEVPSLIDSNGAHEQDLPCTGNVNNSSGDGGISDLEQMLKQKTFTRSEIDRLTELLHSRKVEFPFRDEEKKDEGNLSQPVSDLRKHVFTRSPLQENRGDSRISQRSLPATGVSSKVLEDDVASPAELAKAYMGSRPSKLSPSLLGVHGQAVKEETPLLTHGVFPSKSSTLSLVSKSGLRDGNPEKCFTAPRSRGRSAIYNMARTPYSRGSASTKYICAGPSSSSSTQSTWEHNGQFGSKQLALKRRSSVLDDENESVGAVRRIRQKPNLSYHSSSLFARGLHHTSLIDKPLLLGDARNKVSRNGEEFVDDSAAVNKYSHIPPQSSQMASKILQHLEKFTPPEKRSESKLVTGRSKSPIKLAPNLLHGQALRSLENVESTKSMQNQIENISQEYAGGQTSCKNIVGENCFTGSSIASKLKTSSIVGVATISKTNAVANIKNAESIVSKFSVQSPQVKRSFHMSADEDFAEPDGGTYTNGFVSGSSGEGRKELQISRNSIPTLSVAVEKTSGKPEVKTTEKLASNHNNDLRTSALRMADKENTGSQSTTLMDSVSTSQQDIRIQSTSVVNNAVPSINTSFSLSLNNNDTLASFAFSSAPPCESSCPNPISLRDSKRRNLNSFGSDQQLKALEVDKVDVKNTHKATSAKPPADNSTSAAAAISPSGFVSSIVSAEKADLNDGLAAWASRDSAKKIFENGSPGAHSFSSAAMTTGTNTGISDPNISMAATSPPSFPSIPAAVSIFGFGSSLTQSSPAATTGTESTGIKSNDVKETTFGNLNKPPSSGMLFGVDNAGSNVFGFSSSLASSSSYCSTTVISEVPSTTGSSTSQSVPFQFGSSGASTVFGTSGISTNSSVIDSAAAKPFESGTTFALGTTTSPLFTNTPSSTSSATSSVFSSSGQTVPPVTGAAVSLSPPLFSFGAATTSGAPTSVFGQSTGTSSGSMFSFTSATATTMPLPSLSQSQPLFGNNTASRVAGTGGDQMNMEDGMAEDPVHSSNSTVPLFGQPSVSPSPPGFIFGSTASLQSQSPSPFQFGGQQNQATPQNLSPFQASNSLDFNSGGSFSLGSVGEKGARKTVRVSRIKNRRK